MHRKGFAPLIVIGVIAAIVVVGMIGYFAWRNANNLNQPTSTQGDTPQSGETFIATSTTSTTTAVTQFPDSSTINSVQASSTSGYFTQPMVGNDSDSCAFVASSQVVNPTDWKTYTDPNCGFIVKYSSANNSPANLSGWQSYINNQYGFELKYPPTLYNLTSSSSDDEYTILDLESAPQGVSIRGGGAPDPSESQDGYIITFVYPYATSSFDIDQWLLTQNIDPDPADDEIQGPYPITIDGQPAYEYSYLGAGGGEPMVVVYHNGLVYQMSYDSNYTFDYVMGSSSALAAEQTGYTIFDEMMKSIVFIPRQQTYTSFPTTTSTVGWQTYANQQYGLSVQYPATMQNLNLIGLSSSSDQYVQCGIDNASTVGCLSYPSQQFPGTANFAGGVCIHWCRKYNLFAGLCQFFRFGYGRARHRRH